MNLAGEYYGTRLIAKEQWARNVGNFKKGPITINFTLVNTETKKDLAEFTHTIPASTTKIELEIDEGGKIKIK